MEIQYKIDLKNRTACGLNASGSEEGSVASSREHGNEFSVPQDTENRVAGKVEEEICSTELVVTLINFKANLLNSVTGLS
jgi:hypothetical protein